MRDCARASRAPATIFMARVIFWGDLVLEIRLRMTLSDGMSSSGLELRVEGFERRGEPLLHVVVDHLLLGDVGEKRLVGRLDERVELLLVAPERLDRELVQKSVDAREDDHDL